LTIRRAPLPAIVRRNSDRGPATTKDGVLPASVPTDRATTDRRGGARSSGTSSDLVAKRDDRVHHEETMTSPLDQREDDHSTTGEDHRRVIAIDGPAAAGKTTVARALADRLGATFLDTGLLYRAVTLAALRAGIDPSDGEAIARLARESRFEIIPPRTPEQSEEILLDGELVTPLLRTSTIDRHVSAVSAHPEVRAVLLPIQRRIAAEGIVVMVGRDITTVVVPDAGVKVFLNASPGERARRRLAELAAHGRSGSFREMLREIERRDRVDSTRAVAPLRAGENVSVVETDGREVATIVEEIAEFAQRAWQDDALAVRVVVDR
jgi:cytidylate kinase